MDITFCEMRNKDVISLTDGKNLGHIIDISIAPNGVVLGLILPATKGVFKSVVNDNSVFVPWKCICKIGNDAILVNTEQNRLNTSSSEVG